MDEHQYDIAKTEIKTYIDEKTVEAFGSVFEEHCCNPVVDNVITMLGYIVKALPEYRHIDDIEIYKTLISILYGLHYIESSRDVYHISTTKMYVDLSVRDVIIHDVNLSKLIREFFLLPNPRWNDVIVEIVELYLQVRNNPDLIQNIYKVIDDADKPEVAQYIRPPPPVFYSTQNTEDHPIMDESTDGGYKTRKRSKRKTKKSVKNKINRQRTKYIKRMK